MVSTLLISLVISFLSPDAPHRLGGDRSGHEGPVTHLALSPDGRELASASEDGTLVVWDLTTRQERLRLANAAPALAALRWTTGQELLAVPTKRFVGLLAFDASSGKELRRRGATNRTDAAAVSPDGKTAVVANTHFLGEIFDIMTGKPVVARYPSPGEETFAAAFSQDGRRLALAGRNPDPDTVCVHDTDQYQRLKSIVPKTARMRTIALSPDGSRLATAGDAEDVQVWDTATGQKLHSLHVASPAVVAVAFSEDGARLVTCCGSPVGWRRPHTFTIRDEEPTPQPTLVPAVEVWDVASGKQVAQVLAPDGRPTSATFLKDGAGIAFGASNGAVYVWKLPAVK